MTPFSRDSKISLDLHQSRPRAGDYVSFAASKTWLDTAIAKIEVFNPSTESRYYIPFEQAQALTKSRQASWEGNKRIVLAPDRSKRAIWEPKQSGYAGPLVLQLT